MIQQEKINKKMPIFWHIQSGSAPTHTHSYRKRLPMGALAEEEEPGARAGDPRKIGFGTAMCNSTAQRGYVYHVGYFLYIYTGYGECNDCQSVSFAKTQR